MRLAFSSVDQSTLPPVGSTLPPVRCVCACMQVSTNKSASQSVPSASHQFNQQVSELANALGTNSLAAAGFASLQRLLLARVQMMLNQLCSTRCLSGVLRYLCSKRMCCVLRVLQAVLEMRGVWWWMDWWYAVGLAVWCWCGVAAGVRAGSGIVLYYESVCDPSPHLKARVAMAGGCPVLRPHWGWCCDGSQWMLLNCVGNARGQRELSECVAAACARVSVVACLCATVAEARLG